MYGQGVFFKFLEVILFAVWLHSCAALKLIYSQVYLFMFVNYLGVFFFSVF